MRFLCKLESAGIKVSKSRPIKIPVCLMSNGPRVDKAAIISPLLVLSGYHSFYVCPPLTALNIFVLGFSSFSFTHNYHQWEVSDLLIYTFLFWFPSSGACVHLKKNMPKFEYLGTTLA